MVRPWYKTAALCAKEAFAVAAHFRLGGLMVQPVRPVGTVIFSGGWASHTSFYTQYLNFWRSNGYETYFAQRLLKNGFMFPRFPKDVRRFPGEIRARKRKTGGPLILIGHSIGGLCNISAYAEIRGEIDKLIILGTPFNEDYVFPSLIYGVAKTCGLSVNPPCETVRKIKRFVQSAPKADFHKILYITTKCDPIAPPEAGGLPRAMMATASPNSRNDSHSCLIFDSEIFSLSLTFAKIDVTDIERVEHALAERYPEMNFTRNDRVPDRIAKRYNAREVVAGLQTA